MPTVDDMFPTLDYDSLNKGLGFVNFNMDPAQSLQLNLNNDNQQEVSESKDGEAPSFMDSSNVEVSEVEIPEHKDWEVLTRAERIELVKQQASGMPLTAKFNLNLLKRVSSHFQKQGMYKESTKLNRIASDFEKSMTLTQRETENEGTSEATVAVQENGESLTRTFNDVNEAIEFYDSLVPKVEEIKELANTLTGFNMAEEASSLKQFIRQYSIFDSKLPLLLQGSTVWNKQYGMGKIAWIDGNVYHVVFPKKMVFLDASDAKGQIIFFEKRPNDSVPSGFYRLLNRPVIYKVYKKEEDKEVRIFTGILKLADSSGRIHEVSDYPLGGEFLGTVKMEEYSLQPYDGPPKKY